MEAWRLRGDTVTLNSCLRSWPWRRGMAMMATSQVGSIGIWDGPKQQVLGLGPDQGLYNHFFK